MAKKQNSESAPALIDYAGASAASESANHGNAFADLKSYWKKQLFKQFKVAGLVWGIKEQTNLSRLIQEFEKEETIKKMMDKWIQSQNLQGATNFGFFYSKRHDIYEQTQPKDYGEW